MPDVADLVPSYDSNCVFISKCDFLIALVMTVIFFSPFPPCIITVL